MSCIPLPHPWLFAFAMGSLATTLGGFAWRRFEDWRLERKMRKAGIGATGFGNPFAQLPDATLDGWLDLEAGHFAPYNPASLLSIMGGIRDRLRFMRQNDEMTIRYEAGELRFADDVDETLYLTARPAERSS